VVGFGAALLACEPPLAIAVVPAPNHNLMHLFTDCSRVAEKFVVDLKGSINWTLLDLNGKH